MLQGATRHAGVIAVGAAWPHATRGYPARIMSTIAVAEEPLPSSVPLLRVRTIELPALGGSLLDLLPSPSAFSWVRGDSGLVGWGESARAVVNGRERFSRSQRWWSDVVRAADIDDPVHVPGTGAVAFASFAFEPGRSVLVVPSVVVGRSGGRAWVTTIVPADQPSPSADAALATAREPLAAPQSVQWGEGTRDNKSWQRAVAEAVERINRGELDKVVLARDIVATTANPIDTRFLMQRLAERYPECWTFLVDGLVGATPELLVRRRGDVVTSRVLAGTIRRGSSAALDLNLGEELLASDKDQQEHEYAVTSVAQALSAHCTDLDVPDAPRLLRLANVQHLATDVTGRLADDVPVLSLAASLHPTAAVCGTPTERAAGVIRALEGMDRSRYAGPVGWIDGRGDGELGIALRCGKVDLADRRRIRLFAGCGIVSGSDPASELAESNAKLEPMRYALGG